MKKEFIPYEQALELKELGFDEDVFEWFNTETKDFCDVMKEVKSPLYQQAFRWFREKYGIVAEIGINYYTSERKYGYKLYFLNEKSHSASYPYHHLNFEEAELACLKKLIEIVKNK